MQFKNPIDMAVAASEHSGKQVLVYGMVHLTADSTGELVVPFVTVPGATVQEMRAAFQKDVDRFFDHLESEESGL